MKRIVSFLLAGLALQVSAQDLTEMQYVAYLKASKSMWLRSVQVAEASHGLESFEKAMALYGVLNNTMASKDQDTFDEYLDPTVDLLKQLIEEDPENGEPKAVLSSVYGLVIAYSPWKGMFYGSKSSALVANAMEQQPESPLVQKLYAGSKLYTPAMWGGSVEKALVCFQESVSLYESKGMTDNWLYLDALVGLSMAYEKNDDIQSASETLEKVISLEPQHYWAKSLLAQLDK